MSTDSFSTPPVVPGTPVEEDRTVAILAYITLIGFVVAIILHSGKKTALGAFHLRQVLGLILGWFALSLVVVVSAFVLVFIPFVGPFLVGLLWFCVGCSAIIIVVMGLIAAINGRQTPVPIIGEPIQKYLANTFT